MLTLHFLYVHTQIYFSSISAWKWKYATVLMREPMWAMGRERGGNVHCHCSWGSSCSRTWFCTLVSWSLKHPGAGNSQAHILLAGMSCTAPACSKHQMQLGFVLRALFSSQRQISAWTSDSPVDSFHTAFVDFTHLQLWCWLLLPAAQGQPMWTSSYVKCIAWRLLGWRPCPCYCPNSFYSES